MKKLMIAAVMLSGLLVFSGCSTQSGNVTGLTSDRTPHITSPIPPDPTSDSTDAAPDIVPVSKRDIIPFEAGQLYAAAYLGYQAIEDWDYYAERYLDSDKLPVHYVSDGDYYLVIPRYDGMSLSLYVNDVDTGLGMLRFQDPDCGPFVIQCNASDIFTDVTVLLEYNGETAEFSPFISLKDGSVMIGERGLDLTKPGIVGGGDTDPYVGEYWDGISDSGLEISLGVDGKYLVQISIYRLTSINDGVGWDTGDGISFTATDAARNPISGTITLDGNTATVTFTDSTWGYLPNGTSFQYTRSSDDPNLWG